MPYTNKLESMSQAVRALEAKHASMTATYGTDLAVSLREAIRITGIAIDALKGKNLVDSDINPWQQALDDDNYLRDSWEPLATETYNDMNAAIGLEEKWSISNFFEESFNNVSTAVPSKTSVFAGLGIVAVIAVALAVIVVLK